jgi:hypothetical protein
MTESTFSNDLQLSDSKDQPVQSDPNFNDGTFPEKSQNERVDLGNHEADDVVEPPHVNDEGKLVDADGNVVFTTIEQSIKDGSFVLDSKGRMPGVYLDDIEQEQREAHAKRVEEAFSKSDVGVNSVVERQVNVVNSPLPPITVRSTQENPISDKEVNEPVTSTEVDEPVLEEKSLV